MSLKYVDAYVEAVCRELESRVIDEELDSVYFGGGTPSVLSREHLEKIMSVVAKKYRVSEGAEITLEANPDDLDRDYLKMLRSLGFNRLSVGIQSFFERDLELMKRSHNADQAKRCLVLAEEEGFENINMDLIYGVPGMSMDEWEANLRIAMSMPVHHLSAYHLSFEEGTVFDLWKKKGRLKEINDSDSVEQYRLLREISAEGGYEHYEISNFAKEGMRSRHNTSYWKGVKYIGIGAGAHSYDGDKRRWNVASVKKYIGALESGGVYFEEEELNLRDRYHDYLMTALRTSEGVDLRYLEEEFGVEVREYFEEKSGRFIEGGEMVRVVSGDGVSDAAHHRVQLLRAEDGVEVRVRVSEDGWLKGDLVVREMMM